MKIAKIHAKFNPQGNNICLLSGAPGSRRQQYGQTPLSMGGGSVSGNTPYTPSATPSNLLDDSEANSLMQQYQFGDSRVTPAYSTSGFTPSDTPSSNFGDNNYWGGTPRTPKTPQMHHGGGDRYHQGGKQRQHHSRGRHHNRR